MSQKTLYILKLGQGNNLSIFELLVLNTEQTTLQTVKFRCSNCGFDS